ncbi:MAG: 6-phosphogluconolactonase [Burkholderiales bacterium]|nr:6-phosphogluconolactonase [Burkholderiales bacterium]
MNFEIKKVEKIEEVANFIASSILSKLNEGKRVLFFVPGGSAILVAVKISEILKDNDLKNLVVTLTDERYGDLDHFNSNYLQLTEKGFVLKEAKIISVLKGESIEDTTEKFDKNLAEEFALADYKIGLFGIGTDGHTAGILPGSVGVASERLACHYDTPTFRRITMTGKAIKKLDEVIVFTQGIEKDAVIKDLQEKDIDEIIEPAQILKKVPLLTIFNLI